MPAGNGEAASLVESAMLLRWRAPELALLLADRAVTAAQNDQMAVLRADHLAVFALNRLGRHGEAAHRLFPALRNAHTPAGLRHELQVELAHCAAALGEPVTALGAVHAVLAAGDDVTPVLRGTALVAAAEASGVLGRGDLVTPALDEADELYREDPTLDRDTALLLRATARAADAARHRRCGAAAEAEAQARAGRELLAGLADPEHDSGEVSARLMLEIVLALLDRDEGDAAVREVRPLLRRPVRAAAAGAVGRLRLALATRVHLAEGRHEPALTLLADAVEGAQRHGVDAVLAECLEGLSHVHEARGEFADALHCVRAARAAEGRHRRNVEAARATLLEHCESARREPAGLVDQIAALLVNTGTGSAGSDTDTGLLNVEITVGVAPHRVSEAEPSEPEAPKSEAPKSEASESETPEVDSPESETSERKSSEVESRAVESPKVELPEVQTPEVEAPEAETPEAETPEADPTDGENPEGEIPLSAETPEPSASAPIRPALGLSHIKVTTRSRELADPAALDSVKDPEPTTQEPAELQSAESPTSVNPWQRGARHRRGAGTLVCVSDLLPESALSAGRSGRRRAEEPAEERRDGAPTAEINRIGDGGPEDGSAGNRQAADRPEAASVPAVPASGPPPAPTPRAMEWEPGSAGPAGQEEPRQMGLGDLLAEALAAYQQSRDVRADDIGPAGARNDDGGNTADVGNVRKAPPYGRPGTRWVTGLQLAPPSIDRREDDPSEALTNPLLRLPDFTAEPLWVPPETGRQSAAGD